MAVLLFNFQRLDDDDTLLDVYTLDDICYRGNQDFRLFALSYIYVVGAGSKDLDDLPDVSTACGDDLEADDLVVVVVVLGQGWQRGLWHLQQAIPEGVSRMRVVDSR